MEHIIELDVLKRKGSGSLWLAQKEEPDAEAINDWELIERFLSGDEGAFNKLVLEYQAKVFNLCFRLLGNYAEAEDIAQEVFLTVYRAVKDFRGESRFSTWLYRITVNHCRNRAKYLNRRGYHLTNSLEQPVETEKGEIKFAFPYPGESPEENFERKELQKLIQKKLDELDFEQKEILVLREIEGLSYEEIATILKLKGGTVKSRIHRARMELKEKLAKEMKW